MENLSISDALLEKVTGPTPPSAVENTSLSPNGNIERPHECTLCTLRFKTRGNLNEHVNFYHMKGSVACSECPNVFPTSRDLRIHRMEHSVLRGRCPHCRTTLVMKNLGPVSFNRAYSTHLFSCSRKPNKRAGSIVTRETIDKMNWPTPAPKITIDLTKSVTLNCSNCFLTFSNKSELQLHNCQVEIDSCTDAISSGVGSESMYCETSLDNELFCISESNKFTTYPTSFCVVCNLEFENEDELSQHLYQEHEDTEPEVNCEAEIPISLPAPNVLYCYKSPKILGEAPVIDVKEIECTFCSQTFEVEEDMLEHSERCIFSPQESLIEGETIIPNTGENEEVIKIFTKLDEEEKDIDECLDLVCTNEDDEKDVEKHQESNEKDFVHDDRNENNIEDGQSKPNEDICVLEPTQNEERKENGDKNHASSSKKGQIEDNLGGILIRWLCKYCKKTFGDQIDMKNHKKICLGKESRLSSQVNESEVLNLASAEIGDTNTDIFVRWACKYCKEQFDDKLKMEKHKLICEKKESRRKSRGCLVFSSDTESHEKEVVSSDAESYNNAPFLKSNDETTRVEAENEVSDPIIDTCDMPLISKMTFPCEYCFQPFDYEEDRNGHQRACLNNKTLKAPGPNNLIPVLKYKCLSCHLSFETEQLHKQHRLICPKTPTCISSFFAFCKLCRISFTDFDIYKSHKNNCQVPQVDKPNNYTCSSCHEFFNDFDKFRAHTWNCLHPNKAQCHFCANSIKNKPDCPDCKEVSEKLDKNVEKEENCTTTQDQSSSSDDNDDDDDDNDDVDFVEEIRKSSESDSECSSTVNNMDEDSRDENCELEHDTASPIDIDSLLTTCPKCETKFGSLEDLAIHCTQCQAQPIPGNFEAYVNRNLPVLRCPTCKIFFRGTENLVSHKCEAINTKKRPNTEDHVTYNEEPPSKRAPPQESGETIPKCYECGVYCKDLKNVVTSEGKQRKYACFECYVLRANKTDSNIASKNTPTILMEDNLKSVEAEITCPSKSLRSLVKSNKTSENDDIITLYDSTLSKNDNPSKFHDKRVMIKRSSNLAKKSTPYSVRIKNKPGFNTDTTISVDVTSDIYKLTQPARINLVRLPDNWAASINNSKVVQLTTNALKPKENKTSLAQWKPIENKPPLAQSKPIESKTPDIKSKPMENKTKSNHFIIKRLVITNPNALSKKQMAEMSLEAKKKLPPPLPIPRIENNLPTCNKTTSLKTLNNTPSPQNQNFSPVNQPLTNQNFIPRSVNPNFTTVNQSVTPVNQNFGSYSTSNQSVQAFTAINQNFAPPSLSNHSFSHPTINENRTPIFRQGFVTLVPIGPQNTTPQMGNLASTSLIRFVTPNNVAFQAAGRSATPGAKPMPSLRLGNPRMMLQPEGQPPPNLNLNNEQSGNGNDSSSNKENQKRLPLSSVDDNDGWLLEGVLEENGTEVVVKKCICGNCYRSLDNEDALKEHAWTEHKRLIGQELYLKKIENISQSIMKKALIFARDCSKKTN